MNNLNPFLSVFREVLKKEKSSKKNISNIIKDVIGVTIPEENINSEGFVLYLNTHPVIKNEVLLKQEELLSALKEGTNTAIDSVN